MNKIFDRLFGKYGKIGKWKPEIEHKLSKTTLNLLAYIKSNDLDTWMKVRDDVLDDLYHPNMKLRDVLQVVYNAWLEARKEKRLEMPYSDDTAQFKLLVAPIDGYFMGNQLFVKSSDTFTIEQFYQTFILHMLSEMRFTNVKWLKDAGIYKSWDDIKLDRVVACDNC